MKKKMFTSIIISFMFSGCMSVSDTDVYRPIEKTEEQRISEEIARDKERTEIKRIEKYQAEERALEEQRKQKERFVEDYKVNKIQKKSNLLEFDIISKEDYNEMTGIKVKITNISKKHINSCYATCILKNAQGKELSFESHYVIKSRNGGLSPGASTYFEYAIEVRSRIVKYISFQIEKID